MAKVKLIKARSYNGLVKATVKQPIVEVSAEDAQILVATGYFELLADEETSGDLKNEGEGNVPDYEALSEMTKAELVSYAEQNGVDIGDCKTKAEILQIISAANGGSYTMMELQKEK